MRYDEIKWLFYIYMNTTIDSWYIVVLLLNCIWLGGSQAVSHDFYIGVEFTIFISFVMDTNGKQTVQRIIWRFITVHSKG